MSTEFYQRPMVVRIRDIFNDPSPPRRVTEEQFDSAQKELIRTAAKQWHQIDQSDYWHYLLDLSYVDLQQDLFDYLFPAFLIRWWEGQLSRRGGPYSECDFYRAIDRGDVFRKMMSESRRQSVFEWMTDAYVESVDAWGGHLSSASTSDGPHDLHGPLFGFNALGQSVPILESILKRITEVSTMGRAQWWLVLGTGILWNPNECPAIAPWDPYSGGGGVYPLGSEASIYDHGYLPENVAALEAYLDHPSLAAMLEKSWEILPSYPHGDWARMAWERCLSEPEYVTRRISNFFHYLRLPDLGEILHENPLDSVKGGTVDPAE